MQPQELEHLSQEVTTLSQRLKALEGQHRWQRWAMLGTGLVLGAGLFHAGIQAQPPGTARELKVLTADALHIVDQEGQTRVEITAASGHPWIHLRGKSDVSNGKTSGEVQIGVNADTPFISCSGSARERALLGVFSSGIPILTMNDQQGKTRARLQLRPDGQPRLELLNKEEKALWEAP